jgi:hypothetical protein
VFFGNSHGMCKELCKEIASFLPHLAFAEGPWARTDKEPQGSARDPTVSKLRAEALEIVPASMLRETLWRECRSSCRLTPDTPISEASARLYIE